MQHTETVLAVWLCLSVISFSLAIPSTVESEASCAPNERFLDCGGCDDLCSGPVVQCTRNCHIGCHCREGYVRNGRNQCILKSDCGPRDVTTPAVITGGANGDGNSDGDDNDDNSVIIDAANGPYA